jgi:hypothetical protein
MNCIYNINVFLFIGSTFYLAFQALNYFSECYIFFYKMAQKQKLSVTASAVRLFQQKYTKKLL